LSARLAVIVVTRGDELVQRGPGGFAYVDQVFEEAGLRDATGTTEGAGFMQRLRILERALRREFGGDVVLRLLNPWTPRGFWLVVRHRLRDLPCILIAGRAVPADAPNEAIIEAVRQALQAE
jgi:hypothetical protein